MRDYLEKIEKTLSKRISIPVTVILIYFILKHLPSAIAIREYYRALFPLYSMYISKKLLYLGFSPNPQLANSIISPTNSLLIYPPGAFTLPLFFPSVSQLLKFSFFLQIFVPILTFVSIRRFLPTLIATLAGLLAVHYSIVINTHPDYILQPLMLAGIFLLIKSENTSKAPSYSSVLILAVICNIMFFFKHNLGLFYLATCIACIFFSTLTYQKKHPSGRNPNRIWLGLITSTFIACGIFFAKRLIFFDEVFYYSSAYLAFWLALSFYFFKNQSIEIDFPAFLKRAGLLVLLAPISLGFMILKIGGILGYSKYIYSLFGMGFEYLPVWDLGVFNILSSYGRFEGPIHIGDLNVLFSKGMTSVLFILPVLTNWILAIKTIRIASSGVSSRPVSENHFRFFQVASFAVFGILLLFPLEDFRILQSKLFFFFIPLAYVLSNDVKSKPRLRKAITILLMGLTFITALNLRKSVPALFNKLPHANPQADDWLQMPVEASIAQELDKQIKVIDRSIGKANFYIVNFDSIELLPLLIFKSPSFPQYYIEMRESMLNKESFDTIQKTLIEMPYLVVNRKDYLSFLEGKMTGKYTQKLMQIIHEKFTQMDEYLAPSSSSPVLSGIYDFLVMKRKN